MSRNLTLVKTTTVDSSVARCTKDPPVRIVNSISNKVEVSKRTATINSSVTHVEEDQPVEKISYSDETSSLVERAEVDSSVKRSVKAPAAKIVNGNLPLIRTMENPPESAIADTSINAEKTSSVVTNAMEDPLVSNVESASNNIATLLKKSTVDPSATHSIENPPVTTAGNIANNDVVIPNNSDSVESSTVKTTRVDSSVKRCAEFSPLRTVNSNVETYSATTTKVDSFVPRITKEQPMHIADIACKNIGTSSEKAHSEDSTVASNTVETSVTTVKNLSNNTETSSVKIISFDSSMTHIKKCLPLRFASDITSNKTSSVETSVSNTPVAGRVVAPTVKNVGSSSLP